MKKSAQILLDVLAFMFIFLFMYAAVSKLIDIQKFRVQISQSPMLTNVSGLVSVLVPFVEVGISSLMIFARTRLLGFVGFFALMVMFTTYIYIIMNYSEHVPCSCGGILQNMGWKDHLIFNAAFVALGGLAAGLQYNIHREHEFDRKEILLQ